jgi:hypothetical protein
MKGNKFLIGAVMVQAAVIIGLWFGPAARPARADIPDAGGQLIQVAQLLTASNAKLDRIIDLLQGGKLQVHVVKSDDDQ